MSVLIIDDKEDMRRTIRAMLKNNRLGKYFFEASNGQDGWEFLDRCKEPLHFIISGLIMPRMTGTELLARVRASKKYRITPFLMVSAEANRATVAMAGENEVDAYLTIPFAEGAFEKKVKDLVEKASNPSPWIKHLNSARKFEENGNLKAAIKEAGEAVELSSRRACKPLRELGRLYLQEEKLQEGLECFQEATAMNDLDVSSFHYMGKTYCQLGMMEEAMTAFSKAMEINPRNNDRAVTFATVLLKENRREEAEKVLAQTVQNCQDDLDFTEDIIDLCIENGLDDLAAKTCKMVMEKDPDRAYLGAKQGVSLFKSGNVAEAGRVLKKSAEKFTGGAELMLSQAKSYLDTGETDKAKEVALMLLKLEPDNEGAKRILDKCA